jgi:carboxylesterase type B
MQSSVPTGCELQTLADSQQRTGARVATATGCANATDIAACLRDKSVNEIVGAVSGLTDIFARVYGPNMDGHIFPDQPRKLIEARRYKSLPVIIGGTADETKLFLNAIGPVPDPTSYAEAVTKLFGAQSRDAILARYPAASFASARGALEAATTDAYFTCTTRRVARLLTSVQTEPVYTYFFSHVLETTRWNVPGVRATRPNTLSSFRGRENSRRARVSGNCRAPCCFIGQRWLPAAIRMAKVIRYGRVTTRKRTLTLNSRHRRVRAQRYGRISATFGMA